MILFHGGVGGLAPGDTIEPGMAAHRFVDNCPTCQAHARGESTEVDPLTPDGWVYATQDRPYARYYASRAVLGWLYRVEMDEPEPSNEDMFPTWRAPTAQVVSVLERAVRLTMRERKRLFIRWGGTEREFAEVVAFSSAAKEET